MSSQSRAINYSFDALSASAIVATFAGLLPPLAGLAGLIWYAIQIWESKTVQKRARLWRAKSRAARLARIRIEEKALVAKIVHAKEPDPAALVGPADNPS